MNIEMYYQRDIEEGTIKIRFFVFSILAFNRRRHCMDQELQTAPINFFFHQFFPPTESIAVLDGNCEPRMIFQTTFQTVAEPV